MIIIKCARCKQKIFKYEKIGKGRIWHCWKQRIKKDYSLHKDGEIRCSCGNIIGILEAKWIKMKQNAFEYSGSLNKNRVIIPVKWMIFSNWVTTLLRKGI